MSAKTVKSSAVGTWDIMINGNKVGEVKKGIKSGYVQYIARANGFQSIDRTRRNAVKGLFEIINN